MGKLDGKIAVVTGAGGMRGIGRGIALKLAKEGADVVVSDYRRKTEDLPPGEVKSEWRSIESVAEEVRALGRRCLPVWCDLTVSAQIESLVKQAVEHFGRIDIMVSNARAIIGRDRVPVTELREEVWQHFLAVNTTAVFLATKFAGQVMLKQGKGGRIINIASDAAKRGRPNTAAYNASKFAVLGLTQSSAMDFAPHGITVNAVCPGATDTDRMNYKEEADAKKKGMTLEAYRAQVVVETGKRVPVGRMGQAEDVANLVAFLASNEASFITGQAYNVNGGSLFH